MKTEWSKISLIFLFLVALIGTLLRSAAFISIPFNYLNLVHAHSHTAFQGWVYLMMQLLLANTFLTKNQIETGRYPLQFKLTVSIVIGVLVSFALQGYGLYSIVCSTLFQLLNYWFIFRFLKDTKKTNTSDQNTLSLKFVKTGLWFGLVSTVFPYAIGITSAKGLGGTEVYTSLVYSFMHLQYNGWFLFVVLGLFFNYLDRNHIHYNRKQGIRFYWLFAIIVIPAISLSLLGMEFSNHIQPIAYLSALTLGVAFVFFILTLPKDLTSRFGQESIWFKFYFLTFLASFALKIILQCLSVFPFFESYAFYNKSLVIAYLHLSLIGSISFLFFALLIEKRWLVLNAFVKMGSALLLLGFAITEVVLILAGFNIWHNQVILILGSAAMGLGIFMMIVSGIKEKTN
ncbi:MAG: hypothetical protein ABJH98_04305 [Reichenbachiella sp.]|uniref:hypothetical protein n=1 Tax=Reichenbachiella sp. TaxID=2184521 RepID=UPI00329984F8